MNDNYMKDALNKLNSLKDDQVSLSASEAFAEDIRNMLLEFVCDDDYVDYEPPTPQERAFEKEMRSLFQVLIQLHTQENIDEDFTSKNSLQVHFNKHCLGESTNKVSTRNNIYYDFTNIRQYEELENQLITVFRSWETPKVTSLKNIEEVRNLFKKFFEGDSYLVITPFCGMHNQYGYVAVGLHCYADAYTTNYGKKTIDLAILTENASTVTLYPVDVTYLETKLNNIIKNHSNVKIELNIDNN